MFLSSLRLALASVVLVVVAHGAEPTIAETWTVLSPDKTHELVVTLSSEGRLSYALNRRGNDAHVAVLAASPLGLATDAGRFVDRLKIVSASKPTQVDEAYAMATGKQLALRDRHTAWSLELANVDEHPFAVDFRVYEDGLAFRYRLPRLAKPTARVVGEHSGFRFASDGRVWMQPFQEIEPWAPAYEDYFTNGTPLGEHAPRKEGWAFPGLFETDAGWVLLTEADLDGSYFGAHLDATVKDRTYTIRFPLNESAAGIGSVEPTIKAPWQSPWRVIVSGATLATIAESSLVHHVSRPPRGDFSWVKPGRATWSWWSDHASPRNFKAITPFIDLASKWGWEYSLVDANWNRIENGDIEQLVAYAKERNVGLLLWYNSGGEHTEITEEPRDRLIDRKSRRAEFAKLQQLGIKGVKVDFFQSDKPWMIQHYLGILEDAAEFHLLVDFHGCTIPRGWQRTYPNLVTMEAVRGAEVYSCCEEYGPNAIWQNTILPFTRNVIGSMDYTPVTFTDQKIPHQTTYAHELALAVLFESGIQHFADAVRGYEELPDYAKTFLRDVPAAWDETRFVDGYPGKLAVLARRKGDTWYLGGAEGAKQPRSLEFALPFLKSGRYAVEIISDGANDKSFSHATQTLRSGDKLNVAVRPAGGFVAKISPQ
jgi:hypothetical protein